MGHPSPLSRMLVAHGSIRDGHSISQRRPVKDASGETIPVWVLRTIELTLILNEAPSATNAMFLREHAPEGTTSRLEHQLDRRRRTPSA